MKNKESEINTVNEPTISYRESYSYEDYLKFDLDYMVEVIRGKIYKMSPAPSTSHQALSLNMKCMKKVVYVSIGWYFSLRK